MKSDKKILENVKQGTKVISFVGILVIFFIVFNALLQPIWYDWNNYDTHQGFYTQPEDTIEVVFLGSSVVTNGITPMKMYEEYGICGYNLATEQQPVLASYYWAKEAYRLHEETLKMVVLDVSTLRYTPGDGFYSKAIDGIKNLENRWSAVHDYKLSVQETISNFVPLFKYHSRWNELTRTDFEDQSQNIKEYVRGYNYITDVFLTSSKYLEYIPAGDVDTSRDACVLDPEALRYLDRLVSFCKEKEIELCLIKTPYTPYSWTSAEHNAVQGLAEKYQLEFFDFNFSPLFEEIRYNYAVDHSDDIHPNIKGANKISLWLGKYLLSECGLADVRNVEKYAFMEEQLSKYKRHIVKEELDDTILPYEYIATLANMENFTVFILGKDECTAGLSQDDRDYFKELGLTKLSELNYRDSYLAVFEGNDVVYEETAMEGDWPENTPITLEGVLNGDITYSLKAGGLALGNIASCIIGGIEHANNSRGLNIVVWDNVGQRVVDVAVFDTHASVDREYVNIERRLEQCENMALEELDSVLQKFNTYNKTIESERLARIISTEYASNELLVLLNEYMRKEETVIFLAVKDEATNSLKEETKHYLGQIGFSKLSELEYRDSYIGIVVGGNVIFEEGNHNTIPVQMEWGDFTIISGGLEAGNKVSIKKDGLDYALNERGLNIVVYDLISKQVVERQVFDTHAIEQIIPVDTKEKRGR